VPRKGNGATKIQHDNQINDDIRATTANTGGAAATIPQEEPRAQRHEESSCFKYVLDPLKSEEKTKSHMRYYKSGLRLRCFTTPPETYQLQQRNQVLNCKECVQTIQNLSETDFTLAQRVAVDSLLVGNGKSRTNASTSSGSDAQQKALPVSMTFFTPASTMAFFTYNQPTNRTIQTCAGARTHTHTRKIKNKRLKTSNNRIS